MAQGIWDSNAQAVTVDSLRAELDIEHDEVMREREFRVLDVDYEQIDMAPVYHVADSHTATADVWHVRYEHANPMWGRWLQQEITVIQFTSGGLSGGEGWSTCARWVIDAETTREQVNALLPLLESGIEPRRTHFEEL